MKIQVKARGFIEGEEKLRKVAQGFDRIVEKELQRFGDELVEELQQDARAGVFGPPKAWDNGKPPLIDTGTYIESYKAKAEGTSMRLGPTGQNRTMSNEALADVLEYGVGGIPPRPHLRPLLLRAEKRLPLLARRLVHALLGDS